MNKPVLVVMAAGMGSRYGGMKQIDPVGPNGQVIMDYSLYDARRAGFETVIFVIKHEIEDAFKAAIGDRVAKAMNVKYAFQQLPVNRVSMGAQTFSDHRLGFLHRRHKAADVKAAGSSLSPGYSNH